MTICVGRPIIEILANEGAWQSENGDAVVAASELFNNNPYAEIDRLRAALREARQYVVDAGSDEDPETQRHSSALLVEIQTLVS